jgi:hypothetical protein
MKPKSRKRFKKKLTRDRVVPIISASGFPPLAVTSQGRRSRMSVRAPTPSYFAFSTMQDYFWQVSLTMVKFVTVM